MQVKCFFSFSLLILLSVSVIALQMQCLKSRDITVYIDYQGEQKKMKTALAIQKLSPSLGFDGIMADWTFLNFIQYFGDEKARLETGYHLIPDYFEMISQKDPRFVRAFLILSPSNSIYAGLPNKTIAFLNKALKQITPEIEPLAHYLWLYKGVDEMLFLGDLRAARHSFAMAAKWAKQAGEELTVQRAKETIRFLETNPDTRKVKIAGWMLVLSNAQDSKTQKHALNKLKELGAKVYVDPMGKVIIQS